MAAPAESLFSSTKSSDGKSFFTAPAESLTLGGVGSHNPSDGSRRGLTPAMGEAPIRRTRTPADHPRKSRGCAGRKSILLANSLFNFPSRYLSSIGLVSVFSLRWSLPPTLGCILKQPDSSEAQRVIGRSRRGLTRWQQVYLSPPTCSMCSMCPAIHINAGPPPAYRPGNESSPIPCRGWVQRPLCKNPHSILRVRSHGDLNQQTGCSSVMILRVRKG